MKIIEVVPLVGVDHLRFGMKRTDVHEMLGTKFRSFQKTPIASHPTDVWLDGGFQVFYRGDEGTVEYLELARDSEFDALLFGHSVFATEVPRLVELFDKRAPIDKSDLKPGNEYVFPDLELALWRPIAELPEGRFFTTIGIGTKGYYSTP